MPTSFTEIKNIDKYKTPSAQARWWFFLSEAKEISGCPHKTASTAYREGFHGVSAPVLEYNKNPQALNA
jgi:hypothetical protein